MDPEKSEVEQQSLPCDGAGEQEVWVRAEEGDDDEDTTIRPVEAEVLKAIEEHRKRDAALMTPEDVDKAFAAQGMQFEYDPATQKKTRMYSEQIDIRYQYDSSGRLQTVAMVKDNGVVLKKPRVTTYQYLPSGSTKRAARTAAIERKTAETEISLSLNLDGTGQAKIATGIGFFDHMLTLLAKHSLIDLSIDARGDLHVDPHHTVEDVGICLGKTLAQALGDKAGIRRYGSATLPMDEVLVTSAVDLSGRAFCVWEADVPPEILGSFNAPLAEEFWRAVCGSGAFNLHVVRHHGKNSHHIIEAIFKATARALRQAVEPDPRVTGVPSTKGIL